MTTIAQIAGIALTTFGGFKMASDFIYTMKTGIDMRKTAKKIQKIDSEPTARFRNTEKEKDFLKKMYVGEYDENMNAGCSFWGSALITGAGLVLASETWRNPAFLVSVGFLGACASSSALLFSINALKDSRRSYRQAETMMQTLQRFPTDQELFIQKEEARTDKISSAFLLGISSVALASSIFMCVAGNKNGFPKQQEFEIKTIRPQIIESAKQSPETEAKQGNLIKTK